MHILRSGDPAKIKVARDAAKKGGVPTKDPACCGFGIPKALLRPERETGHAKESRKRKVAELEGQAPNPKRFDCTSLVVLREEIARVFALAQQASE